MENKEGILDALDEFNRKPASPLPSLLEQYLNHIASTGETWFPWSKLKPLFICKLEEVTKTFFEDVATDELPPCPNVENIKYEEMRQRLLKSINSFTGAPFTIQRLCELLINPRKHYKRTDKFMRGIEKNIMVVSTVDPFGNKIVTESGVLLNGLDTNGDKKEGGVSPDTTVSSPFVPPGPNSSPAPGMQGWFNIGITDTPPCAAIPMAPASSPADTKDTREQEMETDSENQSGDGFTEEDKNKNLEEEVGQGDNKGLRLSTETDTSVSVPLDTTSSSPDSNQSVDNSKEETHEKTDNPCEEGLENVQSSEVDSSTPPEQETKESVPQGETLTEQPADKSRSDSQESEGFETQQIDCEENSPPAKLVKLSHSDNDSNTSNKDSETEQGKVSTDTQEEAEDASKNEVVQETHPTDHAKKSTETAPEHSDPESSTGPVPDAEPEPSKTVTPQEELAVQTTAETEAKTETEVTCESIPDSLISENESMETN